MTTQDGLVGMGVVGERQGVFEWEDGWEQEVETSLSPDSPPRGPFPCARDHRHLGGTHPRHSLAQGKAWTGQNWLWSPPPAQSAHEAASPPNLATH